MGSGLDVVDTFIMHVYGNYLNYKYYGKYSETKKEMALVDSSIMSSQLAKELKLEYIGDYRYKEYSYLDTLRNIGHYVFFDGTAYIFTDYGLIQIYGRSSEFTKVAKILTIDI